MRKLLSSLLFISIFIVANAQDEKLDMDAIARIKKEGLENSKVMDIAFHLTDVSGSRLTNSPGFFRAANWARDEMKKCLRDSKHLLNLLPLI